MTNKFRSVRRQADRKNEYGSLEPRRLLAGITFTASTGELFIGGYTDANEILVSETGTGSDRQIRAELKSTVNGVAQVDREAFDAARVNRIVIVAGPSDDRVENTTGITSTIYGGNGNDTLIGGSARDVLLGGQGNDRLVGNGGDDSAFGFTGDDVYDLGDGKDVVWADSGRNVINSGAGNDIVYGGTGVDIIDAGAGNDAVIGLAGDDQIDGGAGDDLLMGLEGNDLLESSSGRNLLYAGPGNDDLRGGSDNDVLVGDIGDDTIAGGGGNDLAYGGSGNDVMRGGDGTDWFFGQDGIDRVFGDAGFDMVMGNAGDDIVDGGGDNDDVYGNDGNDQLFGRAGDDNVFGGNGNDRVFGGTGADNLQGGAGDDDLHGGVERSGNVEGDNAPDVVNGGAGRDTVRYAGNQSSYTVTKRSSTSFAVDDRRSGKTGSKNSVFGAETLTFAGATFVEATEEIVIQPIIVANDNGSNRANFFGNAQQEAAIKARISEIYSQAKVRVRWLAPKFWNNTTANVGSGSGTRPQSDMFSVVAEGDRVGKGSSDPKVVDMYFIAKLPVVPINDSQVGGFATLDASGLTVEVGSRLIGTSAGQRLIAQVVAHEVGHNLGLGHDGAPAGNLMFGGQGREDATNLTAAQIRTLIASSLTQPL